MKVTTVFEGFYDQEPGWEFDMPAFMLKPIMGYVECGSGPAGIDELVEEYLISRFMQLGENGKAVGTDDDFMCQIDEDHIHHARMQFAYAKKGRARNGVRYWRRVVEWDDENEGYQVVKEDVWYGRNDENNGGLFVGKEG